MDLVRRKDQRINLGLKVQRTQISKRIRLRKIKYPISKEHLVVTTLKGTRKWLAMIKAMQTVQVITSIIRTCLNKSRQGTMLILA